MNHEPKSVYELLGGERPIAALVEAFYDAVAQDSVLRPMYPEDLAEPRRRLFLFLVQFFGGPPDYSRERGHPRLRMRHFAFPIDQAARDIWLRHMLAAIESADIQEPARTRMSEYFERASTFLINRSEPVESQD